MRKLLLALPAIAVIGGAVFFSLPSLLDWQMNSVATPAPYPASESANTQHQTLFVADRHDDALL